VGSGERGGTNPPRGGDENGEGKIGREGQRFNPGRNRGVRGWDEKRRGDNKKIDPQKRQTRRGNNQKNFRVYPKKRGKYQKTD